jgi:hypothetical protein
MTFFDGVKTRARKILLIAEIILSFRRNLRAMHRRRARLTNKNNAKNKSASNKKPRKRNRKLRRNSVKNKSAKSKKLIRSDKTKKLRD